LVKDSRITDLYNVARVVGHFGLGRQAVDNYKIFSVGWCARKTYHQQRAKQSKMTYIIVISLIYKI
jgi:hypothetical protein